MKNSTIVFIFWMIQIFVLLQVLPSIVKPFDSAHEDLLAWIGAMTYFIVKSIEDKKSHNELNVYLKKDDE